MTFEKKQTFFWLFGGYWKRSLVLRNGKVHCDVLRVGGLVMTFFLIEKVFQEKQNSIKLKHKLSVIIKNEF